MATYNKFQVFVGDLGLKVHNLNTDTINVYLSNTAPNAASMAVKADLAEIGTGNGYTGPVDTQNTYADAAGTGTMLGTKVVITASGGSVGPFRYVVLYNDTPGSKPLIAWWDYGSAVTLNDGESFSIKFNSSDTAGVILVLV